MLFNSEIFIAFFVFVYSSYLILGKSVRAQNILLLVASYAFYSYWDWRFLSLIIFSTLLDYKVGGWIHQSTNAKTRKALLSLSIGVNLSILGVFKYFNFFADNFAKILSAFGMAPDSITLDIILPLGISFYTFQSISYSFDIYRKRLKPVRNLIDFSLFVAFFPQLVAGPIERASHLLPQIARKRNITASAIDAGFFLILWGYFKKVVIADNVGLIADTVFNNYAQHDGLILVIGILAFTVQIYCDFSGYSDIARGLCKLMGFDLMLNFRLPYFATSPSDFWRRWHISLSTWLRDYLYIPLGGNRSSVAKTYRNIFVTMLLGGLWHGAAWNFVIWGAYHGALLCIYRYFSTNSARRNERVSSGSRLSTMLQMLIMFILTMIGWTIFRSQSVDQLLYIMANIGLSLSTPAWDLGYKLLFFSAPLLAVQIHQHVMKELLSIPKLPILAKSLVYAFFLVGLSVFGSRDSLEFIYFQF